MILNVYKPTGWTSFDVVAKARGILKERKIGHAGTLDPLAEGVLILLTGNDTKKQQEIMKQRKQYKAKIAFGAFSTTFDLEQTPRVFPLDRKNLEERVKQALPSFIGEIEQTIPPFSAKKVAGKRMYETARKGNIPLRI